MSLPAKRRLRERVRACQIGDRQNRRMNKLHYSQLSADGQRLSQGVLVRAHGGSALDEFGPAPI